METAGGIANALHLLGNEPFLVVNGDTFTEIDFSAFISVATQKFSPGLSEHLNFADETKNENEAEIKLKKAQQLRVHEESDANGIKQLVHLVMVNNPPQHPQGDFAIANGLLKHAGEKMLTFSGVGVYHPSLFKDIVKGEPAKLAPLLRKAIDDNGATAQLFEGIWHDIGTPDRLYEINDSLLMSKY